IKDGNAPRHAAQPVKISRQGLFSLDVDDEIWQDVGLEDDDDQGPQPPWLVDEEVKEGIKHMLELDRCEEEKSRLQRERSAMQSWTRAQWEAIEWTRQETGSEDVLYHLDIRARELTRLCALWQPEVEGIPPLYDNSPSWGPSVMQIAAARVAERQASQNDDEDSDNDSSPMSDTNGDEDEDADILDMVEDLGMLDMVSEDDIGDFRDDFT
ncbi:hypothetical protein BU15DRAFT_7047, partial [Melanogaster broomeanus]